MDFHTLSSNDSINQIKCTSCKNYLSYFPIMLTQDETLCGRCPTTDNSVRNLSFEALAQFLNFPCRYQPQGCCDEFLPGEIPEHEKNCKFRVIPCPLDESVACEWQGPRTELLQHCLDGHSDLVLENGRFQLDLTCSGNFVNILEYEKVLLIFKRSFDLERKLLKFALYKSKHELGNEHFSCRLEIKGENNTVLSDFDSSLEENYTMKEIRIEAITCVIVTNSAGGKLMIEKLNQKNTQVDEKMLSLLKCIKCSSYAIPPIYYCPEKSNVVCFKCKKDHGCDSCQKLPPSRNITLTAIASLLTYPCKYKQNGCTFTSKGNKISKHYLICKMKDVFCPLSASDVECPWKDTIKQLPEHVENNHPEFCFENNTVFSEILEVETLYYKIIKFSNCWFRVGYMKAESSTYYFTVQAIGCLSDQYKFEIEIQNPSAKGVRLLASEFCSRMMTISFDNFNSCCIFYEIGTFEQENCLNFKVTVFK